MLVLSNQAIGSIMMALQKCLKEQCDIVEIFRSWLIQVDENDELIVLNPPVVSGDPVLPEEPVPEPVEPVAIKKRGRPKKDS